MTVLFCVQKEEKMVREFRLINEKGQEFSLMDIYNYTLLTDPSRIRLCLHNRVSTTWRHFYKQS